MISRNNLGESFGFVVVDARNLHGDFLQGKGKLVGSWQWAVDAKRSQDRNDGRLPDTDEIPFCVGEKDLVVVGIGNVALRAFGL